MSLLQRPAAAWGGVIVWAGAIWFGSSLQIGSDSPLTRFGPDKAGHFIEFGILAMLAANALLTRPPRSATTKRRKVIVWSQAVAIIALWGVIDEIHQLGVPGRTSDPFDVVADILGGMVGAWLLLRMVGPDRDSPQTADGRS